jgi:hypothetical protein
VLNVGTLLLLSSLHLPSILHLRLLLILSDMTSTMASIRWAVLSRMVNLSVLEVSIEYKKAIESRLLQAIDKVDDI